MCFVCTCHEEWTHWGCSAILIKWTNVAMFPCILFCVSILSFLLNVLNDKDTMWSVFLVSPVVPYAMLGIRFVPLLWALPTSKPFLYVETNQELSHPNRNCELWGFSFQVSKLKLRCKKMGLWIVFSVRSCMVCKGNVS